MCGLRTLQEVAANLHIPSLRFAMESKSMRGKKLLSLFQVRIVTDETHFLQASTLIHAVATRQMLGRLFVLYTVCREHLQIKTQVILILVPNYWLLSGQDHCK